MRLRSVVLAAAGLSAAAGFALGQGLEGENLLTGIPDGFVSGYDAAQNGQEMHEFIPAGESVDDWSRMLTIQIFHGAQNADVGGFASQLSADWASACPGGAGTSLGAGEVNGYAYALWRYECPLNPATGKPELMWMKAISGADAAYVVQYAYRAELSDEREAPALAYLEQTSACDTRDTAHACPPGM